MWRILDVASDVSVPNTRVIVDVNTRCYIVGKKNIDYWAGSTIRHKYMVIPTTTVGETGTIGQVLEGAMAETSVYCFVHFTRRNPITEERSDYLSSYDIYFPSIFGYQDVPWDNEELFLTEPAWYPTVNGFPAGNIFATGGNYYRLQTETHIDGAGFLAAQSLKIENPIQTFDIKKSSSSYDPVTDSYSSTTTSDVSCFVEVMLKDYDFVTPGFEDVKAGDKAISVLESDVEIEPNDFIGDYRVLSVRDMGTWRTAHCRYENP